MLVASCASNTPAPAPAAPTRSHAAIGAWGFDPANLSKTVKPGDDFYLYANEGWLKTAKIPTGFPSLDAFVEAHLETEKQLDELITELTAHPHPIGSVEQQLSALFESYTDVARLNALGLEPIRPGLDAIMALGTRSDVARMMARPFIMSIVDFDVVLDQKDPKHYVVEMIQSGLGLPSREYYLDPGEPYASHRIAYRDYIAATLTRAGLDDARERADRILALETAIAEAHWKPEEMRDPVRMYHAMSPAELATEAPGFDWPTFLAEGGIGDQTKLVIGTDTAVEKLAALFGETPVEDLKSYLVFHYVDGWSGLLSEDLQEARFAFFGRRLQGIDERRPLRPRAIQFVSGEFGEGLGRAYVQRYFPAAYRAQLDRMIGFMRTAFRDRIEKLEWMDEPTRVEALAKLDRIASQVGYPDRWKDYGWVRIDPTDLVGNVERLDAFDRKDEIAKLKEPRRDWEWPFPPQIINAGYQPDYNRVVFPAAILQPPFFDPKADPAVNFGAIAAIIGHEMGHGFDDEGSASDGDGRLATGGRIRRGRDSSSGRRSWSSNTTDIRPSRACTERSADARREHRRSGRADDRL